MQFYNPPVITVWQACKMIVKSEHPLLRVALRERALRDRRACVVVVEMLRAKNALSTT